MKLIARNQYLEKLINVIGTPDIKVISAFSFLKVNTQELFCQNTDNKGENGN